MNLHWGRTLENERLMVRIRPRNKPNYSIPFAYNYTQDKHFWDSLMEKAANRSSSNHSALYAKNDFLKKSRILTGIKEQVTRNHSITMVIVISSMFLFFTITITAAVVVFCKKRNTVFALQKCEEDDDEDNEYEMDDLTDVEYTSEYESEGDGRQKHNSHQRPSHLTVQRESIDSSLNRPLIVASTSTATAATQCGGDETEVAEYLHHLIPPDRGKNFKTSSPDSRGAYQRMVVTAVLENQHLQDENSNERTNLVHKFHKKYNGLTCSHTDTDFTDYSVHAPTTLPAIDVTYLGDPPSYDSLSYTHPNDEQSHMFHQSLTRKKHLTSNNKSYESIPYVELTELPTKDQCSVCKSSDTYVKMPEKVSSSPSDTVLYVNLPPKVHPFSSSSSKNSQITTSDSYGKLSEQFYPYHYQQQQQQNSFHAKGTQSVGATPVNESGPDYNVNMNSSNHNSCNSTSKASRASCYSLPMSLPATPLDELSYRCLSTAIASGSRVLPLAAPPNHDWRDSTASISTTLDKIPAVAAAASVSHLASWDDLQDVTTVTEDTIKSTAAHLVQNQIANNTSPHLLPDGLSAPQGNRRANELESYSSNKPDSSMNSSIQSIATRPDTFNATIHCVKLQQQQQQQQQQRNDSVTRIITSPSTSVSLSSLSSNIVTSICSSPLSSTPVTPPAGFRNDSYLHSSSTDDSGIVG